MTDREFIEQIAALTKDGECLRHGPTCTENGEGEDCWAFAMENDHAWETLNNVISDARYHLVKGGY